MRSVIRRRTRGVARCCGGPSGERFEAPAPDGVPSIVHVRRLLEVAGRIALVVRRFDRAGDGRIPYLSAMAMLDRADGERASYPEIVDGIASYGAQADCDRRELYRRLAFNVLVSSVDDHLRNHGFLWGGREGWRLSPAFELNPTAVDVRERTLTTSIDLEDRTCDLALVLEVAPFFGLGEREARSLIRSVAAGVGAWRSVASALGASRSEIDRMSSAFDHDDAWAASRL